MTEYIKNPLSGKLRGVTYEDGKIIDVHIRDTDDVVKVFVPVRHGRWEMRPTGMATDTGPEYKAYCTVCNEPNKQYQPPYCPHCGAKMDGGADNEM